MELLKQADTELFFFVNHYAANSFLDWLCPLLRNKLFWIPLYVAAAVYFFRKYKANALWLIGVALLCILLADQISSSLIKPFFGRLRPCNNELIKNEVRLLVECGRGFSFVSSHAANHFALAVFFSLFLKNRAASFVLMTWAFSVAFAQVYVGVHYPGDVLAGGLLGAVIGLTVMLSFKKLSLRPVSHNRTESSSLPKNK